jgi:hypothetical protein
MQKLTPGVCARVGMRWSLLFAALGVLTALLLLRLLGIQALITEPGSESLFGIVVGLATLCLSAALLGRLAGRIVYLSGNYLLINMVIGVVLALGCVVISAIAGSAVGVLLDVSKEPTFVKSNPLEEIGVIVLLISLYGGGPAALLGFSYGVVVKLTLDRKLKRKPGAPISPLGGNVF